jgi:hypothetical protein
MQEKETLEYIQKELKAILSELSPKLNELLFIKDCLNDLINVSMGKEPEYKQENISC